MPAKFVSVEDFAARAGLGDVDSLADEVTAKARASIEGATVYLSSIIRTEFDAVVGQTDEYYVDYNEFPWVGEFPRLYLSRGFVTTPRSSIALKTSVFLNELSSAGNLDSSWMVLNQTKGTLLITGSDELPVHILRPVFSNMYFVSVTYDAGFEQTDDAYGTIYEGAPDWLGEAALVIAKSLFDNGVPCDDKGANAQGCCHSVEHLIGDNIRFLPSALKPLS